MWEGRCGFDEDGDELFGLGFLFRTVDGVVDDLSQVNR